MDQAGADHALPQQSAMLCRHARHHAGVVAGATADLLQRLGIGHAVGRKEIGRARAAEAGGALRADARHGEVGGADPQAALVRRCGPAFAQPVRQADVVRVHVRDDHAQHRQALQLVGKDVFPLCPGLVARDAAVHHRPAVAAVDAVAQQPQVDVVQRERQCHADPLDPRRHRQRAAGLRQGIAQGVMKPGFELVAGEVEQHHDRRVEGVDAGGNASSSFVLVYNLYNSEDLYKRFPAGEGQAYLVGGFNASYLRRGDIVLIPIRMGAGLRLGINAGYMKFSKKQKWLPF